MANTKQPKLKNFSFLFFNRKQHEKNTEEKLDHLNEKIALATSSLQSALGGISGNLNTHTEKVRSICHCTKSQVYTCFSSVPLIFSTRFNYDVR